MATVDFEKEAEKISEKARQESAEVLRVAGLGTGQPERPPEELVAPELRDGVTAVNPETGRAGEEHTPSDPTATPGNPQNTDANAGNAGGSVPPTPPNRPNGDAGRPGLINPMLTPAEFKGKAKSFLNPDAEKNLWDTLDKKMEEALRGNTPEEVAQNMTFAALTFLFDMIGNWAEQHRKEAKRLQKEYEEKTATYDHNMGVEAIHKNLAFWAVIADHPALRQYQGRPLGKEGKKAALNLIKTDMNVQKQFVALVNSMPLRKHENGELDKVIINAVNMEFGDATPEEIKRAALDQDVIKRAVDRTGIQIQANDLHQQVNDHQTAVDENRRNRDTLNAARTETRQATPDRTADRGQDNSR